MTFSYAGQVSGWLVTVRIPDAHDKLASYPLLPDDLIVECDDGTFSKVAPGLGIVGFRLTDEQRATLKRVEDVPIAIGGLADFFQSGAVAS